MSPVEVSFAIDAWLARRSAGWPLGYRYELGGDYENSQTANESIAAKVPIAALIIVMLLVGQFNSVRRPAHHPRHDPAGAHRRHRGGSWS